MGIGAIQSVYGTCIPNFDTALFSEIEEERETGVSDSSYKGGHAS